MFCVFLCSCFVLCYLKRDHWHYHQSSAEEERRSKIFMLTWLEDVLSWDTQDFQKYIILSCHNSSKLYCGVVYYSGVLTPFLATNEWKRNSNIYASCPVEYSSQHHLSASVRPCSGHVLEIASLTISDQRYLCLQLVKQDKNRISDVWLIGGWFINGTISILD